MELQIDEVRSASAVEATATVRCILGPVRRGARFTLVGDPAQAVDLQLVRIEAWGSRFVEELDPVHTALVTLRGTGIRLLRSGAPHSGWQSIRGVNPPL
ncbi:hypothetical protein [Streptomyces sp. NPDC058953]|uniref:hypothetical protein n=1 Tax=Streptomyces sp. NPDC058953 TaxID=3346676 RepID=UPI0036C8E6BF